MITNKVDWLKEVVVVCELLLIPFVEFSKNIALIMSPIDVTVDLVVKFAIFTSNS